MERLLKRIGIEDIGNRISLLGQLEQKQVEYLDRIDHVTSEERSMQLKAELQEIEMAISRVKTEIQCRNGIRRDKDMDVTQGEINQLKTKKSMEELYSDAMEIMKTGDYKKGAIKMCELAKRGYAPAQYQMGEIYLDGKAVLKDEKISAAWFYKAAMQGHMLAQEKVGFLYFWGKGIPYNLEKSAMWYEKSAIQGNVIAQIELGRIYRMNLMQDYDKAAYWLKEVVKNERGTIREKSDAQIALGSMYFEGEGVEKDYKIAAQWFEKAAMQGSDLGQYKLARVYYYGGYGVEKNLFYALEWAEKAMKGSRGRFALQARDFYDEIKAQLPKISYISGNEIVEENFFEANEKIKTLEPLTDWLIQMLLDNRQKDKE